MWKALLLVVVAAVVLVAGWAVWRASELPQLRRDISTLQAERAELVTQVERLCAARRVAQVDVVKQRRDEAGQPVTALLFQEIGADGVLGVPAAIEIVGETAYFEALVVKFTHHHVQQANPERQHSLVLFRRIFGDQQAPASAVEFDRMRQIGAPRATGGTLERRIWERFWQMVEDPQLAGQFGVRVAQLEAAGAPLKVGQVWEVTADAAGGVNLRLLRPRGALDAASRPAP